MDPDDRARDPACLGVPADMVADPEPARHFPLSSCPSTIPEDVWKANAGSGPTFRPHARLSRRPDARAGWSRDRLLLYGMAWNTCVRAPT
jgi:hypothetical protein